MSNAQRSPMFILATIVTLATISMAVFVDVAKMSYFQHEVSPGDIPAVGEMVTSINAMLRKDGRQPVTIEQVSGSN